MSAQMNSQMQDGHDPAGIARLQPMLLGAIDGVVVLEAEVYPFPWTRGNFIDALSAGYLAWTLNGAGGELLAYCVSLRGVDEMHLLNITVAPPLRRRGLARRLFDELLAVCRKESARRLWLEVRTGNRDARAMYRHLGFVEVGRRKGYYPAPADTREDAVVMSLAVPGAEL